MAKNIKAALSQSVDDERAAVENRFEKAESLLNKGRKPEQPKEVKKPIPKTAPVKPKVIRDSFTIPESDYRLIALLKEKCLKLGFDTNKGEILRAGLKVLAELQVDELRKAIESVERVKTGRPKQL